MSENRAMKQLMLAAAIAVAVCSLAACQRPANDATESATTAGAAPATTTAAEPAKVAPTNLDELAQRLVTQSAAVKEGEVVMITGRQQDAELMENIAVEVAKAGGYPMVDYSSDRLSKRLFFDVPDTYDARPDALGAKLADVLDVVISLGNGTTENLFEGADPKRVATRSKAGEAVQQAFRRNNVRTVDVGNNLYPTAWRAERYGMSEEALASMFWNGINVDYAELQARGEQVKAALAGGKELRITNPNGTDLVVQVQGRPVGVSDGIISADDLKEGGSAVSVYLPAGEVFVTPVPGTATGKVVATRSFFRGKQVDDLTLTFAEGKLTAMAGSGPGFADMKAAYDAIEDVRKDLFAYVDLGINPNIKLAAESKVGNWVPAGAVTLGMGNNLWAGGDNSVPYQEDISLQGSTVTMDGKVIVENGELKL
jgi:leucyl aminopeptidase (aminopeptidase T)